MASKTRGSGEGMIRRRVDGRWEGRISLGWGPANDGARTEDGRPKIVRRFKCVYGRTRDEVVKKMRAAQKKVDEGQPLPDERTNVDAYLDWWLDNVAGQKTKATTVDAYRWLLDRYVRAHIGRESLAKLSAVHVQTMMTALERRGLSPASRRKVRAVLRKAYADAIRLGVASFNPVDAVDAPKVSAPLISDALTQVEADQLRKAMAGTRYEPLFLLCLGTGLRKGEASALRWCDVDLESATVTVAGTLKRTTNGELIVDSPKTSAGKREVPLPKRCVEALRSWKAIQAEERIKAGKTWGHRPEEVAQGRVETKEREEDFVFTTPHGMPVNPRNVTRAYHAVTQKAGLGKRRLHALRHTAATSWIESDVDLSVVSRYLGHANFSITADTYVAVRPETLRKAADAMDRWLS